MTWVIGIGAGMVLGWALLAMLWVVRGRVGLSDVPGLARPTATPTDAAARAHDQVLQPLVVARLALEVGRPEEAHAAVDRALGAVTELVRDMDPDGVLTTAETDDDHAPWSLDSPLSRTDVDRT